MSRENITVRRVPKILAMLVVAFSVVLVVLLLIVLYGNPSNRIIYQIDNFFLRNPIRSDTAVLTINGFEVTPGEYLSYMLPYKDQADKSGEWSSAGAEKTNQKILDSTLDDIRTNYQLMTWAKEEGFRLEDVTDEELQEALKEEEQRAGGSDKLEQQIKDNHMTREVYEYRLRQKIVQNKLRDFVYSENSPYVTPTDEDLETIYQNYEFYTTKQVLVFSSDDKDEDIKQQKKIQEALEDIREGKKFEDVMEKYNEDPNAQLGTDTIYIAKPGDLFPEYENAAKGLKTGETSDIIKTQVGYHIIKKVEPSKEEMRRQLKVYFENYKVNEKMDDLMYAEKIIFGKNYRNIVPEFETDPV